METTRPYARRLYNWLESLPEEELENFAKEILLKIENEAAPEKKDKPLYSETVRNARLRPRGRSLAKFVLETRFELPDDLDFSRPSAPAREIDL